MALEFESLGVDWDGDNDYLDEKYYSRLLDYWIVGKSKGYTVSSLSGRNYANAL